MSGDNLVAGNELVRLVEEVDRVGDRVADVGGLMFLGGREDRGDFFFGDEGVGGVVDENDVFGIRFGLAKEFEKGGLAGLAAGDDKGDFGEMFFYKPAGGGEFAGTNCEGNLVDVGMFLKSGQRIVK